MNKRISFIVLFAFVCFGYLNGSVIATLLSNVGIGFLAVFILPKSDSFKDYLLFSLPICLLLFVLDHQIIQDFAVFASTYFRAFLVSFVYILNGLFFWFGRKVGLENKVSERASQAIQIALILALLLELLVIFLVEKNSNLLGFAFAPIAAYMLFSFILVFFKERLFKD